MLSAGGTTGVLYTDSSLSSHCQGPSFRLRSWRPQTDAVRAPSNSPPPALGHGPEHPPPRTGSGQEARFGTGASRTHPAASPPTRRPAPGLTLKRTGMSPCAAEPAPPTVNGTKSPEGAGRGDNTGSLARTRTRRPRRRAGALRAALPPRLSALLRPF